MGGVFISEVSLLSRVGGSMLYIDGGYWGARTMCIMLLFRIQQLGVPRINPIWGNINRFRKN